MALWGQGSNPLGSTLLLDAWSITVAGLNF